MTEILLKGRKTLTHPSMFLLAFSSSVFLFLEGGGLNGQSCRHLACANISKCISNTCELESHSVLVFPCLAQGRAESTGDKLSINIHYAQSPGVSLPTDTGRSSRQTSRTTIGQVFTDCARGGGVRHILSTPGPARGPNLLWSFISVI